MSEDNTIFVGQIVHSVSLEQLEFIENGILVFGGGVILAIEVTTENLEKLQKEFKVTKGRVRKLEKNQFLIPGLIDTHIHAPQYPNAGLGYDLPLLQWLETYTFPLEKRYSDETFAKVVYDAVVKRSLSNGTTTACYFATIHKDTALLLADSAVSQNQRAFVGKVNMNSDSPPDYTETLESTIADTEAFLDQIAGKTNVFPIITPRFALSCDMPAMTKLGEIAARSDVHIQTHISENKDEVLAVAQKYPDCANYASVYDKAGLLTPKTILAHGVYLTDDELVLLKSRGCSISHCPNSNNSLQSGVCVVQRLLKAGLKVALGTDCSGGYSVSILDAIRQALQTSQFALFNNSSESKLSIANAFFLATLGGAQALSIDSKVGNFIVGKEFDAIVVDMENNPATELFQYYYTVQQLFQKFIYLGDDRNISDVYVAGRKSAPGKGVRETPQCKCQ